MPFNRALLLINRKSRNGATALENAYKVFENAKIELIIDFPDNPEGIRARIAEHAKKVDYVVIGGGDGTLNGAAAALMQHALPLGILPLGTANDLARTLDIPLDISEAASLIVKGNRRVIDLGCVNEKYFFNVANIGLGVKVKQELTAEKKQRWGVFSYAHGLISAYKKNHPFKAVINCDGKILQVHSIQIAVGNGRYYGGGMVVAEDATIDDHKLALYSIKPISFWRLFLLMPFMRKGQFDQVDPALLLNGKNISISTAKTMPVSIDGEVQTATPAHFTVVPKALQVFAPPVNQEEVTYVHQERQTSCI